MNNGDNSDEDMRDHQSTSNAWGGSHIEQTENNTHTKAQSGQPEFNVSPVLNTIASTWIPNTRIIHQSECCNFDQTLALLNSGSSVGVEFSSMIRIEGYSKTIESSTSYISYTIRTDITPSLFLSIINDNSYRHECISTSNLHFFNNCNIH